MKKFKLTIDTDTINMENEIHINNFAQKIKNLSQHCVNFIKGLEDVTDCANNRFFREFHDNNNNNSIDNFYISSLIQKISYHNLTDKGFSPLLDS